jgi:hypothetical protein
MAVKDTMTIGTIWKHGLKSSKKSEVLSAFFLPHQYKYQHIEKGKQHLSVLKKLILTSQPSKRVSEIHKD